MLNLIDLTLALISVVVQVQQAEQARVALAERCVHLESDITRVQRETQAERAAQAQELADMTASYRRLERLVGEHLRALTQALQLDTPLHSA